MSSADMLKAHATMMQALSDEAGQAGPFIDFMLGEIASTLEQRKGEPVKPVRKKKTPNKPSQLTDTATLVYSLIKSAPTLSAEAMGTRLNLTGRQVRTQLAKLKEMGLIEREGSNKKGRWPIK